MTAATPKQIAFAKRLMIERPTYAAAVNATDEQIEGMSKSTISTLIDHALKQPVEVATADSGPSEKQKTFLATLLAERKIPEGTDTEPKTKAEASTLITKLMTLPKLAKPKAAAESIKMVEPGMYYRTDGEGSFLAIYKVQNSHTTGKPYAKRLVMADNPGEKGSWVYAGRDPLKQDLEKLTFAKAVEFGHMAGVCMCCGALLTDPKSVEAGIGPVCGKSLSKKETAATALAGMEMLTLEVTPLAPVAEEQFDFDDLFDSDIKFTEVPQS